MPPCGAAAPNACMKRSIRSRSASSRIRARRGGALEADEPPDERVIAGVRRIAVLGAQAQVEAALGVGNRRVHRDAEPAQPRSADRYEERLDGLSSSRQIARACL